MTNDDPKQRLAQLSDRIEAAKGATQKPETRHDRGMSQAELAWRMVIELTAGIAIGFGIGYGLDSLFGTKPFLLVLFTLLGFAAGVQTMMRSAREIQEKQLAEQADMEQAAQDAAETKRD